jgi:radical SAM superfamily enzyme YgiQ (UPF0313 family)
VTNKRVLFLNPAKGEFFTERIHMGFTLLGQILSEAGCLVRVIDYSFLNSIRGKLKIPTIEEAIADFKPDVVGISVFSYLYDESREIIDKVSGCTDAPIMVGGPHVTLFPEDFTDNKRVSHVVRGEAEAVISDMVANSRRTSRPEVVDCLVPTAEQIPPINLDIALGSEYMGDYQIQLSRGCPFNCSFCNVDLIAGRRVRPRDLELCLGQIEEAVRNRPSIRSVSITDDCPTFNRKRFKEFLREFAKRELGTLLTIDNVRADLVDEEMLQLYVLAGGQNICLGAESGHPEVFKLVNKGESLDKVVDAAGLIRKYGLQLGLCFVIGLPGDTMERHMSSLALAKQLKPDYIYWNMCTPWPGTEVHEWFLKHGELGDVKNFLSLIDQRLNYENPPAVSPDFTKEERIRAWLMSNLETYNIPIFSISNLRNFPANMSRLLHLARKYRLYKSLFIMLWEFVSHKLWYEFRKKMNIYRVKKKRSQGAGE